MLEYVAERHRRSFYSEKLELCFFNSHHCFSDTERTQRPHKSTTMSRSTRDKDTLSSLSCLLIDSRENGSSLHAFTIDIVLSHLSSLSLSLQHVDESSLIRIDPTVPIPIQRITSCHDAGEQSTSSNRPQALYLCSSAKRELSFRNIRVYIQSLRSNTTYPQHEYIESENVLLPSIVHWSTELVTWCRELEGTVQDPLHLVHDS